VSFFEIKNLSVQFQSKDQVITPVDRISFDIKEGEIVALVGESGCGKTVTALSILRLLSEPPARIASGEIFFEGNDLLSFDNQQLREIRGNQISMIFQEPMGSFNPILTIGDQLTEGMMIHLGQTKKDSRIQAIDLLRKVGLSDPEKCIDYYPHQLSGGMLQRVMIAIAISCSPKLIIADEPTTSLDATIQMQILELLQQLVVDFKLSLLLITHNLGIVANYADRVNIMYSGRLIEKASVYDLFTNPVHPYTQALLTSIPNITDNSSLISIQGEPPNLYDLPSGCYFAPRCSKAQLKCEKQPELFEIKKDHVGACWFMSN